MSPNNEGIEYHTIPNFRFSSGHTLDIQVAYRQWNPSYQKVILIPTAYGGFINEELNYVYGALTGYRVIVVGMLGAGESTSPSNNPNFPPPSTLRYEDCINSQYSLLHYLGIPSLHAVLGFSMGGQQAYYWAVMHGSYPGPFVKNVIIICSSAKTSGHNYALLEGTFTVLEGSRKFDKEVDGGKRRETEDVRKREELRAFGRAHAGLLTSPEWFRQELWREFSGGADNLREYLNPPVGQGIFEAFDTDDLLAGGRMWQAGDVGDVGGNGDWKSALEKVEARVLLMPSRADQYFRPEISEDETQLSNASIIATDQ